MNSTLTFPLPPRDLGLRTGHANNPGPTFWDDWERIGREQTEMIKNALPADWSFTGKRTLDFGCGSGRTLRNFAPEAARNEMWGCDIHADSVRWLQQHLSPPFQFFELTEVPAIPRPDSSFDLVWAMSVFTHIAEGWSGWLLELHRVLAPGGLALVSFLGEGMIGSLLGEAWDPDHIGMNTLRIAQSWDDGGPVVFHSEWWLRAHWGRGFDIVWLRDGGGHGLVLLQKREVVVTRSDLEALEVDEPREIAALRHNIDQLHDEERRLRREQEVTLRDLQGRIRDMENSTSWRITSPLRALGAKLR